MKLFSTHSRRRPERAILVAGIALAMATGGCVTPGTYEAVVSERDKLETTRKRLEAKVARLEQSNKNLDAERVRIADAQEDLRQTNLILSTDLGKVRKSEELLSGHLADRERRLSTATDELQMLRNTYSSLVEDLEEEVSSGQIEIEQLREGIRVNLAQEILFGSGSSDLSENGKKVLRKISNGFAAATYLIEVQGHTDDVPTSARLAKRYKTNWELAGARATEVVRLIADAGVDPTRLRATSYGPFQPVAANTTREGRGKNRRIEIRLTPVERLNSVAVPAGT